MYLTDLQIIRPQYESNQEETFAWFIDAHVKAENREEFRETIRERLWHVGCKPDRIAKRGHVLADFLHREWADMRIYRLHEQPQGLPLGERIKVFQEEVDAIFETYYPATSDPPDHLIHVSCTGYVSPSGAQKIVSKRDWGQQTTVTHAYHMGCYGSIPALRMGQGFASPKTDVVHTEICSIHSNPALHQSDQLISQSLFADGFIKYSLLPKTDLPCLKVLRLKEEIIPASTHAMTWNVVEWGFQMSLSKEVIVFITRALSGYLQRIQAPQNALFAIHPGGPKILTHIQKALNLADEQIAHSTHILKEYGNMSSATLPHIWERILHDESVADGTPIVSLAFGPGLSISGASMVKQCGS
ncbi:MAG: naringenin-chalcone synthase [Verrucomicrobia bacterium]|nr:naringenin-chalcone synthase [Verrucomicrobiota bacterium]MDE3047073.1 naringenin-chalcone synthase [Verrucomicrobiota bacterium]